MKNYLQVLEKSLHKKMDVLCRIEELCVKQERMLKDESVSEEFEQSIEEKGLLIDELNKLDEGFESLYEHIREQLSHERDKYKPQIKELQDMIQKVTDKSVVIQVQEARNNRLAEAYFASSRMKLQHGRKSSKVAMDYYKNMNQSHVIDPQFMDRKK